MEESERQRGEAYLLHRDEAMEENDNPENLKKFLIQTFLSQRKEQFYKKFISYSRIDFSVKKFCVLNS